MGFGIGPRAIPQKLSTVALTPAYRVAGNPPSLPLPPPLLVFDWRGVEIQPDFGLISLFSPIGKES